MKKLRRLKETSSYVGAAEDEGLYDAMGSLLEAAKELTDYELHSPEEAIEALYEEGSDEAIELAEAIDALSEEIDSVESEAYFNELDDEEGFEESYKTKKKIIRVTENDLTRIVKKVIKEGMITELGGMDDSHPRFGNMNLKNHSSGELDDILHDRLSDDDDYYGTFDGEHKVGRNPNGRILDPDFEYDEYDEESFEDFDSYRDSKYGRDKISRSTFNSTNREGGKKYFDQYQEKSGGQPFRIRKKRR